jgi:DNA-binding response OmpR family regulator
MVTPVERILEIDDDRKLCCMIQGHLEPLGCAVSLAHSGPDGLGKALEDDFRTVILDPGGPMAVRPVPNFR